MLLSYQSFEQLGPDVNKYAEKAELVLDMHEQKQRVIKMLNLKYATKCLKTNYTVKPHYNTTKYKIINPFIDSVCPYTLKILDFEVDVKFIPLWYFFSKS